MRSRSSFRVANVHGRDRLVDVRSEPPVAVRLAGGRVLLVGSAAAPVGGDQLALDVEVDAGATAEVGSAAASIVWPARPHGDGSVPVSVSTVSTVVGAGASLQWWPEPTVLVRGARHEVRHRCRLDAGASLVLAEELVLGRSDEPSGDVSLDLRVEALGLPVVHHRERFGPAAPGWGTTASAGSVRHVVVVILIGRPAAAVTGTPEVHGPDRYGAALHVDVDPTVADALGPVVVVIAAGPDRPSAWGVVERVSGVDAARRGP